MGVLAATGGDDAGADSFVGAVVVSFVVSDDELPVGEELLELGVASWLEQAARPSRGIARVAISDFRSFKFPGLSRGSVPARVVLQPNSLGRGDRTRSGLRWLTKFSCNCEN